MVAINGKFNVDLIYSNLNLSELTKILFAIENRKFDDWCDKKQQYYAYAYELKDFEITPENHMDDWDYGFDFYHLYRITFKGDGYGIYSEEFPSDVELKAIKEHTDYITNYLRALYEYIKETTGIGNDDLFAS